MAVDLETDVMRLALRILTPCLILDMIVGNPALVEKVSLVGWAIGFGLGVILLSYVIAYGVGKVAGIKKGGGLRTFTLSSGIQNYGFIALPVTIALFPGNPGPAGLILVHGLGIEIALWTVGILIVDQKSGAAWRLLINGPLIAVILGLTLNYSGLHLAVPGTIQRTVEMLGAAAIPISLFMIGATIGRYFSREILQDFFRTSFASCFVRLALLPAIIVVIARWLPMPDDMKLLVAVQVGMPAAVIPIMVAQLYGGHPETAIKVVFATTVVSLVTSPLVIGLALQWLG